MIEYNALPVVITRPLVQAMPLAHLVESTGRKAIIFPLLEIHPLSDQSSLQRVLHDLERYAMVAFVSPNAIDAAFAIRKDWPKQVLIAIVGEGSRAALARHGLTSANAKIVAPTNRQRTDSQTLLEVLDVDALHGKKVLLVRGETGRELLVEALREKGVEVEPVAAYRRVAPALDQVRREQLQQLLAYGGEWLITSSEALRILIQMAEQVMPTDGVVKMQQQKIIVSHVRIFESARALGFVNVVLTGSGDEQLVAALQFRP